MKKNIYKRAPRHREKEKGAFQSPKKARAAEVRSLGKLIFGGGGGK